MDTFKAVAGALLGQFLRWITIGYALATGVGLGFLTINAFL